MGCGLHTCVVGSRWQRPLVCGRTDGLAGGGQHNTLQNKLERRHLAETWAVGGNQCWRRERLQPGRGPHLLRHHPHIRWPPGPWGRTHNVCPTFPSRVCPTCSPVSARDPGLLPAQVQGESASRPASRPERPQPSAGQCAGAAALLRLIPGLAPSQGMSPRGSFGASPSGAPEPGPEASIHPQGKAAFWARGKVPRVNKRPGSPFASLS